MSASLLSSWDTFHIVFLGGFYFFWRGVPKAGGSPLSEDLCAPNKLIKNLLHLIYGIPVHTSEKETWLDFFSFFSCFFFLVTNDPSDLFLIPISSVSFCFLASMVSSVFDTVNRVELSFFGVSFSHFFNLSRSLQIPPSIHVCYH